MDQCLQVALFAGTDAIARQSNFIFSPLSLRAGLALLATGTNSETLRQLLAFVIPTGVTGHRVNFSLTLYMCS
jgi:serpin B